MQCLGKNQRRSTTTDRDVYTVNALGERLTYTDRAGTTHTYTYDYADRRIRRSMDTDGAAGASAESVSFAAYAGDARTIEIARTAWFSGGFLGQVVQRNFYGNGTDEILAVDKITWNGTTPTTSTYWTFTDHQDSVRDIVSGNAADRGQVVEHRQYDSFGKIVARTIWSATIPGIDFGYAGRPLESSTGLSDNRTRWYEPGTGRFINEDHSGFKGGDVNLYRYVGNDPLDKVDPSGLAAKWAGGVKASVPAAAWAGFGQIRLLSSRPQLENVATPSAVSAPRVAPSPYQRSYRTAIETIRTDEPPPPAAPRSGSSDEPYRTAAQPRPYGQFQADTRTPRERYRAELRYQIRYGTIQESRVATNEYFFDEPWRNAPVSSGYRATVDLLRPQGFQPGIGGQSNFELIVQGALLGAVVKNAGIAVPKMGVRSANSSPITDSSVSVPRSTSGAESAAQYAKLTKFYGEAQEYGAAGIRQLEDGRFRFYGRVKPADKAGEMIGARKVREWDPATENTRWWVETLDHQGRIRQVRPETGGPKVHHRFDAEGNYVGKW